MKRRFLPGLAAALAAVFFSSCDQGTAQITNAVTTNSSVTIATGNTYQVVLPTVGVPPAIRRSLTIQNNQVTADNCWIFFGTGTATKATSILLPPGQAYTRYYPYIPSDAIQATCATTGDSLYVDVQ